MFASRFAASATERQLVPVGTTETLDPIRAGAAFRQLRGGAWMAAIESGTVKPSRWSAASVSVTVRNLGNHVWTQADQIRVGTSAPRDAHSLLAHPGWESSNRPVTLNESRVPPGALATLEFLVVAPGPKATTQFELVADGNCWIPNTKFVVVVGDRRPAVALYLLEAKRRHFNQRPA